MDPLTPKPRNKQENEVYDTLVNVFEQDWTRPEFPLDIARNIQKYTVDDDFSSREVADNVMKVQGATNDGCCIEYMESGIILDNHLLHFIYTYPLKEQEFYLKKRERILEAEHDIMRKHVEHYLLPKEMMMGDGYLKELSKIKPINVFTDLKLCDIMEFGLIQKEDLSDDRLQQYLDYRAKTQKDINMGRNYANGAKKRRTQSNRVLEVSMDNRKIKLEEKTVHFVVEPQQVNFTNFEKGNKYEVTLKITNVSSTSQSISIYKLPKHKSLKLDFIGSKLASGMTATAKLIFKPDIIIDLEDQVIWKNSKGELVTVEVKCTRDPPKLYAYVYRALENSHSQRTCCYNQCLNKIEQISNITIDCGSCFVTQHILIHLVFQNAGNCGQFFLVTEEQWSSLDSNVDFFEGEFISESLWIYPNYICMNKGEMAGIYIIFHPLNEGHFSQTFHMICDNNCFEKFEITGNSVGFTKNIISVDVVPFRNDIQNLENHCIFLGNSYTDELSPLILTLRNKSSLALKCIFIIGDNTNNAEENTANWLIARENVKQLEPNSSSQVFFDCNIKECNEGYIGVNLSMFVSDIPIASLSENEEFSVFVKNDIENIVENLSVVDVRIMKIQVACYIEHPSSEVEETTVNSNICKKCQVNHCKCTYCDEPEPPSAILMFGQPILDFGILPVGIDVQQEFHIGNIGEEEITWKLMEMKYNIDNSSHVEILNEANVDTNCGKLSPNTLQNLHYVVRKDKPASKYLSILVVFSVDGANLKAENICLVSYEIIEYSFSVRTGFSDEAIICPMEMLFTGIPIELSFQIKNLSPIQGAFYFFKPVGNDSKRVDVKCCPKSGILSPQETKTINLTLKCHNVGIIENAYIPCFIGPGQNPIMITLLCVVDCVHVFFYLPESSSQDVYQKVLWPPKVIYEFDEDWKAYCTCEEAEEGREANIINEPDFEQPEFKSEISIQRPYLTENVSKHTNDTTTNVSFQDTTAVITSIPEKKPNILECLEKADSEVFLRDNITQIFGVQLKQAKNLKVYIENVTPKATRYAVQSTNFPAKNNMISRVLNIKYKKTEELWESMISTQSILVEPEISSGKLNAFETKAVDIWIYANTWGIYTEEIIVDMDDISSFSFSMVIEVVGAPLYSPLGGSDYPTLRLGSTHHMANETKRKILICNTSSIPLTISWLYYYLNDEMTKKRLPPFNLMLNIPEKDNTDEPFSLVFTDFYMGQQAGFDFFKVLPSESVMHPGTSTELEVVLDPALFKCHKTKEYLMFYILGKISLQESDRLKSNYYFRAPQPFIIQVTGTIECPMVQIDIEEECQKLHIFANEVLLRDKIEHIISFTLWNKVNSILTLYLHLKEPYYFVDEADKCFTMRPANCRKIALKVKFSHQDLLEKSEELYRNNELTVENHMKSFVIDRMDKTLIVEGIVTIKFAPIDKEILCRCPASNEVGALRDGCVQKIPLQVDISYPSIIVKPVHLKFGYVTLGCTHKAIVSVINLTGYEVMFEVYKSCSTQELSITPNFGRIAKSVGVNYSFSYITIYFTPKEPRNYQESIRISTNIPKYYIDLPIKGACKFNEKFEGTRLDTLG